VQHSSPPQEGPAIDEALREQNDRLAIIDVISGYGIAIDAAELGGAGGLLHP